MKDSENKGRPWRGTMKPASELLVSLHLAVGGGRARAVVREWVSTHVTGQWSALRDRAVVGQC